MSGWSMPHSFKTCKMSIHLLTCRYMSSLYRQLADELRAGIAGGTYPPGSRLPSESELAERYGASRGTIRQAFTVLAVDGLISSRKGTRRLVLQQTPVQSFSQ